MAKAEAKAAAEQTLSALLEDTEEGMVQLFVKVMNLHAGYQIEERSSKQLVDAVRLEIERSLSQGGQIESDEAP